MRPLIKMQSVVLDCKEPKELAKFYVDLLGGEIAFEIEGFVIVSIPGGAISISCQFDEKYIPPIWPSSSNEQMIMEHLDFTVQDIETAVQYALSLGATKSLVQYWQPGFGPEWVTLFDPAGHPFCLCGQD
ncbi:MAG: VOC family protein [Oscillospiraceae bacterium]|nr:VOC family protein [Oscillospiraceae bacterium]